jgi:hypothetical protein
MHLINREDHGTKPHLPRLTDAMSEPLDRAKA